MITTTGLSSTYGSSHKPATVHIDKHPQGMTAKKRVGERLPFRYLSKELAQVLRNVGRPKAVTTLTDVGRDLVNYPCTQV